MTNKNQIEWQHTYQKLADMICSHYILPSVKIRFDKRIKNYGGIYQGLIKGAIIRLKIGASPWIVLHELAHHFRSYAFNNSEWPLHDKTFWLCYKNLENFFEEEL